MTKHGIKVGMRVSAPNGWDSDNKPRPHRIGTVEELYGPNQWPRVAFDDARCDLETCTPDSLTIIPEIKIGNTVKWIMQDGNIMTGTLTGEYLGVAYIERVDGGQCTTQIGKLSPASYEDVMAAVRFFAEIGR